MNMNRKLIIDDVYEIRPYTTVTQFENVENEIRSYDIKHYLTLADLYNDYSACDLTLRDHNDNVMIWYGEFSDMPIRYACMGFQKCTVNMHDVEIEVII